MKALIVTLLHLMLSVQHTSAAATTFTYSLHKYEFHFASEYDYIVNTNRQQAAATFAATLTLCGVKGHLADLTTKEEIQAISTSGIVNGQNAWIGLTDSAEEGKYVWTTNQPLSTVPGNDNWSTLEPNQQTALEDCVNIIASNGKWNDVVCSTANYGVLVEFDCAYPSPTAVKIISGHRYEYYPTALLPSTWEAAVVACSQMVRCGTYGHLVTLSTSVEQAAVKTAFQTQFSSDTLASWIGLSDKATENTFLWVNGETYTTPTDPTGPQFSSGEPNDYNNGSPGEDCVSQRRSDSLLNDQRCLTEQGFICEFDVNCPTEAPTKQVTE
ncbi:collectin-11 [Mayamaea pseudoterrestris]|nr:collectin-11 [Mayamaea pseudoterrestris]